MKSVTHGEGFEKDYKGAYDEEQDSDLGMLLFIADVMTGQYDKYANMEGDKEDLELLKRFLAPIWQGINQTFSNASGNMISYFPFGMLQIVQKCSRALKEVDSAILGLASPRFREREASCIKILELLGEGWSECHFLIINKIQQATKSSDAEVGERAEAILGIYYSRQLPGLGYFRKIALKTECD